MRTIRELYPYSYRDAQRLASTIYKSGIDADSEIEIMREESRVSRRRYRELIGQVEELDGNTETLPMIKYSLRGARHSEVNLAAGANMRKAGTSFTKLFYERIGHLRTKDVSITVDIRLNEDDKVITKGPFNLKMSIKLS